MPIPSPLRITLDVVTDGNTLRLDCSCGFHLSKCGIHLYEAPDLDKGQVCWPPRDSVFIPMYNKKYVSKPEK